MNRRVMRVIRRAMAATFLVVAQNGYSGDAEILMTTDDQTIYPYEPITVSTCVSNKSGNALIAKHGYRDSFQYRRGTNGTWQTIGAYGIQYMPPFPKEFRFEPYETIGGAVRFDVDSRGKHIFDKPGDYFIQCGTVFGESEPLKITVKELEPSESILLKEIEEKKLYLYFTEGTARVTSYIDNRDNALTNLQMFVSNHPQSRYATWAKLGCLYVEENQIRKVAHKTGKSPTPEALKPLLERMRELAPTLPSPQREHCWFGMGLIASELGDAEMAEKAMKEVRKGRNVRYFEEIMRWRKKYNL